MINIEDYASFKKDLQNKKVLIWGLGVSGGGSNMAAFFAKHGARVRIIDIQTEIELEPSIKELSGYKNIEFCLGGQRKEDFLWADLIIRNPAIPPGSDWNTFIKDRGLQVEMELNLFMKYFPGVIVGITGTRGKSTTCALIYEILKKAKKDVFTGGNNKLPLLTRLDKASQKQIAVVEMSSFQLSSVNRSPDIAVVTNIYPDHLNWHPDMKDYIKSKENIVRFQTSGMKKILNMKDKMLAHRFASLGSGELIPTGNINTKIKDHTIYLDGKKFLSEKEIPLKGDHNLENLSLAIMAARQLGVSDGVIKKTAKEFQPLEFRQQTIKQHKGITFINDSCATMPEGLMAALDRFKRESKRIYLIAGGVNKNLNLKQAAKKIDQDVEEVYFLPGSFYEDISGLLKMNKRINGPFSSLYLIVKQLKKKLSSGDCVLFSPGAASFNLFRNEWDRGLKFNQAVNLLYRKKVNRNSQR